MDVVFKNCSHAGLIIPHSSSSESTVVAKRCKFANSEYGAVLRRLRSSPPSAPLSSSAKFSNCLFQGNTYDGIRVSGKATIHLHGEATKIDTNGNNGIFAQVHAKVIIHLPSHHNTLYNNGRDRKTETGGTITNVEDD